MSAAPELAALDLAALDAASFPAGHEWSEASWAGELAAADRLLATRHNGAELVAAATFLGGIDDVELIRVMVAPHARRQGLARELIAQGAAWGIDRGAARMLLEVEADNLPALATYRSTGFSDVIRRKDYYGPGRDAWVMEAPLASLAVLSVDEDRGEQA